jgi:hypothetical protein
MSCTSRELHLKTWRNGFWYNVCSLGWVLNPSWFRQQRTTQTTSWAWRPNSLLFFCSASNNIWTSLILRDCPKDLYCLITSTALFVQSIQNRLWSLYNSLLQSLFEVLFRQESDFSFIKKETRRSCILFIFLPFLLVRSLQREHKMLSWNRM